MGEVVVYGVTHVVWSKEIFEAILVNDFVLKNFNKHIEATLLFIGIESDLKNTVHSTLVVHLVLLVSYHEVEDFLDHAQTWVEDNVTEFWTTEDTLFHVLKRNVLEAKYFLGVVVSDGGALHPTDFHLHDVLQKSTPDKIVVLALKWAVTTLKSDYFIVQIVYVVKDVVTQRRCCSRFQFEDNRVSLLICSSGVNLRS